MEGLPFIGQAEARPQLALATPGPFANGCSTADGVTAAKAEERSCNAESSAETTLGQVRHRDALKIVAGIPNSGGLLDL